MLQEFGARLIEINIDQDPDLRARYDYDVPVIFLGARKAAKHRLDLAQFRRQLRDPPPGSEKLLTLPAALAGEESRSDSLVCPDRAPDG